MNWWLLCVLALATWFAGRTQGRLSATINEPGGPSTASSPVLLQTEAPRNITVVIARTYEISCSSNMGVTPVWRHNDSLVTNSPPTSGTSGIFVREPANRERVLVLQNVTQNVVGTYVCLEGDSSGADSATFVITTANPTAIPGFPQHEVNVGTGGTRATLHALISATPPPQESEVLWYFNGHLIVDGAQPLNVRILEPNEITFPRTITTVLMGTYTCVVNTTAGVGTATFRVQVRVQPSLTISPATNVTTRVGLSIAVTCTDTEGNPAPTFTWTHNDGPLEQDERTTITNDTVTQSSRLTITSLMPGDRGTYRCLAINPRGSANKEIYVNVQYAPIFSGVSRDPTTWIVGDEVLITAHLTGSNPPFTSHRLLKDAQLVTSDRIQVTYRNSSGNFTFRIPQVMVSDEGRYTLEVTNPIGVGHINFTIIVYSPPTLVDPRTFFYGTVGNSVTLNLTILNAKPLVQPANISWMFNNVPISIDGNRFTQDVTPDGTLATLTIRGLTLLDDGGYKADVRHVSSNIPLSSSIMQLVVRNPSNPPTNLTVLSDSDCSVNLSWAPPQTDDDTARAETIVIEYSQAGRTWSEVARVPVRNTTATVRLPGGEADASYQLRARSHSDQFGDGMTSNPTAHFSLYPGSSFPAVTVRTALPSVPDVLRVSWVIPESACFQFTLFDVQCTSPNNTGTFRARAESLEANVSGLAPNVQYSCWVRSTLADWQRTLFNNHQTSSNAVQNYTYPAPPAPPSTPMGLPGKPPTPTTIPVQFTLPPNHELISHYQVIVLRILPSSSPPTISPDLAYPYGFQFASYEDVNNNVGNVGPYIAAEIDAESFKPNFTLGGSKDRDQYNYSNDGLKPNSLYTCFLRAFPRWVRSGSSGEVGRRQASSSERQYVVFSSSDFLPAMRTAAINTPGPNPIAPGAIAGAVTPVIIIFVLCIIIVTAVVVFLVLRSSRKQNPSSPSVESSEDSHPEDQFSLPLDSADTPDLVPHKMNGGVELQSLDEKPSDFTPSSAIPVQEFLDHVEKFDASRQLLFQQEFEWISNNSPWHSSDASNDPLNDDKNRYSNITAFDHSRVRLTPIEGVECSDYINANYVTGYRDAREYIATQGPLDQTVDNFWRMVWEQNSATIVMLTNLVELGKAKCSQYWPNDTSLSIHGSIRVKLEHSVVLPDYTIRNLTVESLKTGERRTVLQFHYTKWPDYGTPKLAAPLLNFLKAIRKSNPDNVGPIVVHCSAGVGRSGTVMAIDFCLQQIKKEKVGNVRGFVSKMRDQRNYMVQTEQQYTFIHYALLEAIAYGDTSFPLSDFPMSYEQLKEVNKETGRSLLEEEFDRLTTVRTMVSKSLFVQRVKLKGDGNKNTTGVSEFRAHYVDSYLEPQLMVVCDGPTEDSTAKFWQMVWDERCAYLIMLTPQDGDYHCYWPNFGSLRQYGNLIVEVEEESAEHVYTTRKLLLTDSKQDGVTHRVQQYQFIGWATQFFPSVPTFVDFLCDVLKKTDSLQKTQRVVIHDTKSFGPSGIFCSLYYCVERLRLERMVDVFQAVQKMQLQRPGMVESVQQYAFIYDCMFEFIRTYSDPQ